MSIRNWVVVFTWIVGGVALSAARVNACTNILVTRSASTDGSTIITYACDGEFHPHLRRYAAKDYAPGEMLEIKDWSGNSRGWIPQVEHTNAVVGLMNEHQLVIAESTFSGRAELQNPSGMLHYWDLMRLALLRAKTAREAIRVMTSLVAAYGYRSEGESISIADPSEVWILEIIGPGPGGAGAEWVARKVPDGYISAHANKARIGEFPPDDPENCLYSENVVSFAIEKGYYDPHRVGLSNSATFTVRPRLGTSGMARRACGVSFDASRHHCTCRLIIIERSMARSPTPCGSSRMRSSPRRT